MPVLGPEVAAIIVGSLALGTDPPATAFEYLVEREVGRRLVVIDPNVRPAALGDRATYVKRVEAWCGRAHVIKLSDDDAGWLYPRADPETVVDSILERGAHLVLLTRGSHGALAKTTTSRVEVSAPTVDVVDTVGAGDAFNAGFLSWLWRAGRQQSRWSSSYG